MKYNFDEMVNRRNTNSLKWDETKENELPMWVADMDFKCADVIREAIMKRFDNGVFGYSIVPDEWADAYVGWWKKRHNFEMDKEALIFAIGVVPAISSMVRKLTTPNENVVLQTPVYNIFFNSIINNGARVLESELAYDGNNYSINWQDFEEKMANPQTSLMILCNPHNPVGKIWSKEDLARIGDIAVKYNVTVISDEIHCDITAPGKEYVPFASVSENCRKCSVTCIAPTKAFNMAGMQTAAVYVPDPFLRHKVWRGLNTDEVAEGNVFATDVAVAAFTKGEQWLDECRQYLWGNRRIADEFIKENLPEIHLVEADATYLLWVDCSKIMKDIHLATFIREKTGLYLSEGEEYGLIGENFLRINIACPKERLMDGLNRLKTAIKAYQQL